MNFTELLKNAHNCLKETDEKETKKFICKYYEKIQKALKKYEEQKLEIKGKGKI